MTDNLRGALWLVADMSFNIWALSIVKAFGGDYPPLQVVFIRAVVGFVLLLPWIVAASHRFGEADRLRLHAVRIALSVVALAANYYAVARLPFALFTSIGFTRPILMMALAALFLGERIAAFRWAGAVLGLVGVMLAVDPAGTPVSWGMAAMAVAVVSGTVAVIVTRKLRGTPTLVMMTFYTAGLSLATAAFVLPAWQPVAPGHILPLLGIGIFSQCAQYCFIRAHWVGDAGVLGPVSYLSLVFSALAGYLAFAEVPTLRMALGSLVIVAGAVIATRGGRIGRNQRAGLR